MFAGSFSLSVAVRDALRPVPRGSVGEVVQKELARLVCEWQGSENSLKRSMDIIAIENDDDKRGPVGAYVADARPSKRIRPSRAPSDDEWDDASWTCVACGEPVAKVDEGTRASFTPIRGPAAETPPALSPLDSECWGGWKPA